MADKISKTELIQRIQHSRAALETYLNSLSEAQLTGPASPEGWTAKDHLVHLTLWEAGIVAMLRRQSQVAAMGLDDAFAATHNEDEINQRLFLQNRARSLQDVLAGFQETHHQMLETLAGLSEEELYATLAYFQPSDPDKDNATPVIEWVIGNTYAHYDSHLDWVQKLLQKDTL